VIILDDIPQTIQLLVTEVISPVQWYTKGTSEVCHFLDKTVIFKHPCCNSNHHNLWPVFWKLLHYYNTSYLFNINTI